MRHLRQQKSITQEQLADQAGVSRTYIGKLESRGENVTLEVLAKLATGLGVRPWRRSPGASAPTGEQDGEPC